MKNHSLAGPLVVLLLLLSMASCSEFLDINEDPNNPTAVPLNQLLPSTQLDISNAVGTSSGGLSSITMSYMHQIVQRGNHNDYGVTGGDFGVVVPWNNFYTKALTDLKVIIDQGTEEEAWHYVGVAQLLSAYSFSVAVDIWGDVPFEEANRGAEIPFPNYDSGADVYAALFPLIDEAIVNLERNSSSSPGTEDLIYGGNIANWRKFGNSLKLKLYTQTRLVNDVSTEVSALLANDDFIDASSDFELQYGTGVSPNSMNPGAFQETTRGGANYYVSPFFYEIMTGQSTFFPTNVYSGISDPRVPYYFFNQLGSGHPNGTTAQNPTSYRDGNFVSIYTFSFNIDPNEGFDQGISQSICGLYPLGGRYDDGLGGIIALTTNPGEVNGALDVPQRMLTHYADLFNRAELALTGVSGEDARALFEQGMRASFDKVNEVAAGASAPAIDGADINTYITEIMALYDAAADDGKLEQIITQKWIANFGYGVDPYNDFRRTGYPVLHNGNTDNLNITVQTRQHPFSFPHVINDLQVNPNAPAQRNVATDRVFWDR